MKGGIKILYCFHDTGPSSSDCGARALSERSHTLSLFPKTTYEKNSSSLVRARDGPALKLMICQCL